MYGGPPVSTPFVQFTPFVQLVTGGPAGPAGPLTFHCTRVSFEWHAADESTSRRLPLPGFTHATITAGSADRAAEANSRRDKTNSGRARRSFAFMGLLPA